MKCLTGPAEWHNIVAAMKRKLVPVGLSIPDPIIPSVTSAHHFWSTWIISAGSDIRAGNEAFLSFVASVQVDVLLTDLENLGFAGLAKNSHNASAHSRLTPCMISVTSYKACRDPDSHSMTTSISRPWKYLWLGILGAGGLATHGLQTQPLSLHCEWHRENVFGMT